MYRYRARADRLVLGSGAAGRAATKLKLTGVAPLGVFLGPSCGATRDIQNTRQNEV
jgi:hypothetical protein